jgi:hypothetical protein
VRKDGSAGVKVLLTYSWELCSLSTRKEGRREGRRKEERKGREGGPPTHYQKQKPLIMVPSF